MEERLRRAPRDDRSIQENRRRREDRSVAVDLDESERRRETT